jgi:hypothetical protein
MAGRMQSATQSDTRNIAADHVRDCKPEHFFRFRKNHKVERISGTTRTYIAIISVFGFIMHSHFIFLDSLKAILVHCAHRLLSESTLILCTGTRPVRFAFQVVKFASATHTHALNFSGSARIATNCSTTPATSAWGMSRYLDSAPGWRITSHAQSGSTHSRSSTPHASTLISQHVAPAIRPLRAGSVPIVFVPPWTLFILSASRCWGSSRLCL